MREKLYSLVFEVMNDFRQVIQSLPSPKSLKDLVMRITPPKGVRRKASADEVSDEGIGLFDCEGAEIVVDEVEAFDIDNKDIDMTVETVKNAGDEGIVQEITQNLR